MTPSAMHDEREDMGLDKWKWSVMGAFVLLPLLAHTMVVWGHVDLDPRQSIPKKWELYTLNVPTEKEVPTVAVRLRVPEAFEIEVIEHSRVWQMATQRDARGFIREVRWSGSQIPPQTFENFKFLARNPNAAGIYRWTIEQHYQTGDPATWEAQTQIISLERTGGKRAEEAWRSAQVATTLSLIAIGIAITLIIIVLINIVQHGRRRPEDDNR